MAKKGRLNSLDAEMRTVRRIGCAFVPETVQPIAPAKTRGSNKKSRSAKRLRAGQP